MTSVSLEPEQGIAIAGGQLAVVSLPAWMRIVPFEAIARHRWVRIRYSTGFFDPLTRPILRFETKDGRQHYHLMNGAILGSGEWIGRVPKNTIAASISPTNQIGPYSFRIDKIEAVNRGRLLARGLVSHPGWTYVSVTKRLTNSRQSAWSLLKFASAATSFSRYADWCKRLQRPVEFDSFDRPRSDWQTAPEVLLFARLSGSTPSDIRSTIASLQLQIYQRWRLYALADEKTSAKVLAEFRKEAASDSRLRDYSLANGYRDLFAQPRDSDLVAAIAFGDRLSDIALGCMIEAAAPRPDWQVIYSDEDSDSTRLRSPILKPDWSPVLDRSVGYLGQLTCMRYRLLAKEADVDRAIHEVERHMAVIARKSVGHLRRILYTRKRPRQKLLPGSNTAPYAARTMVDWPSVGIVLPTKDRPELLEACLEGLKTMTDYPNFEVVIVDNNTTDRNALALLAGLGPDKRFKIIRDSAPFNFSRICNDAAKETPAQILAFLNNDIVMCDRDWLKALVSVCADPAAGVVGAKLLFPDGRLQHAGIVLGIGGLVGHTYFKTSHDESGYLNELNSIREISAVTGACCAVAREKFLAVGGFDEINLPIELGDVDLCLRIAEKGWQNYWTPHSVLTHLQSASRGTPDRPTDVYAGEQEYFMRRWADVVRDDPYFHPALSLFSRRFALA